MLRYENVRAYVHTQLKAREYSDLLPIEQRGHAPRPMPIFSPGPNGDADLRQLSPESVVFLSVGGGAGLTTEQLFDQVYISVLVVGRQGDYDAAEQLALDVDASLMSVAGNTAMGDTLALAITRTGGRPALSFRDSANRYAFSCSYISEAESDLVR